MFKIKNIIDLSHNIYSNSPYNPFFNPTDIQCFSTIEQDGWYSEKINLATHIGTHVDAPGHRLKGGKKIDEIPLNNFIGTAVIIDLRHKKSEEMISFKDLEKYDNKIISGTIVLLVTGWCKKISQDDIYINKSVWLGADAANYLANKKVKGVGIDHFSIGGSNPKNVTIPHEILMRNNILIFEELNFPDDIFKIEKGIFIGFALKIKNGSGSPIRAVIIEII